MDHISQFKEDMIESGYAIDHQYLRKLPEYAFCQCLLDPRAWEAVGITRGWAQHPEHIEDGRSHHTTYAMRFFENVIMRKMSIEDALAAISQEV
tara:strand:+ start:125 stop:406 length:282 start_codon:yes stop_codon:yes gene_type:complete